MELLVSFNFLTILTESVNLLPKNGKLMVLITLFSSVLYTSCFFLFTQSIQSLAFDVLQDSIPDPTSFNPHDPASIRPRTDFNLPQLNPRLKQDTALILTTEIAFFLAMFMIFFLTAISTIIVSSASYTAKPLSLKDFSTCVRRTWTRTLITASYAALLTIAYVFTASFLAMPLLMIFNTGPTLILAAIYGIVAFVFYLHLSVSWALAIVVSVMEENCYGFDALGKAATLVKGKRLHGFLLNVGYIVCLIVVRICAMGIGNKWVMNHSIVSGLFVEIVLGLVQIILIVAYTVLYFHCKKIHGEEVELHGRVTYTKLPTTSVDNMPAPKYVVKEGGVTSAGSIC